MSFRFIKQLSYISFLGLASSFASAQTSEVADNFEFQQYFHECFIPPKEAMGNRFTLHFSIKKDGSLIGKPFVFWLTLQNDPKKRAALEPLLIKGLQKCFPVPLEDPFKDMVAGTVHAMEYNLDNETMGIQY